MSAVAPGQAADTWADLAIDVLGTFRDAHHGDSRRSDVARRTYARWCERAGALQREPQPAREPAADAAAGLASSGDGPYAGLSPYGTAVTGLERILGLDDGPGSWDEARAIAGEAATLAVSRSVLQDPRAGQELAVLVRDILQALPDTADEQEWRDRAGALGVTGPGGQPYRALTEEDL